MRASPRVKHRLTQNDTMAQSQSALVATKSRFFASLRSALQNINEELVYVLGVTGSGEIRCKSSE